MRGVAGNAARTTAWGTKPWHPAIVALVLLAGCAKHPLPTYPIMDEARSLELVAQRNCEILSVQGQASITLEDLQRQSITLDGVFFVERPNKLRVRAWKLGQAVFDLTTTGEGSWQYVPREEARSGTGITRDVTQRMIDLLTDGPPPGDTTSTGKAIEHVSGLERRIYDRDTLTLGKFIVTNASGQEQFSLTFDDYRVVADRVWPMRLKAVSERGVVEIRFSEIEINGELPPAAFKPPTRAERLP